VKAGSLEQLALMESHGASSSWWRIIYIAITLALNRSVNRRSRSTLRPTT